MAETDRRSLTDGEGGKEGEEEDLERGIWKRRKKFWGGFCWNYEWKQQGTGRNEAK